MIQQKAMLLQGPRQLASLMDRAALVEAVGGSSDTGLEKMNPLTVRHFDDSRGEVVMQFLDMYHYR